MFGNLAESQAAKQTAIEDVFNSIFKKRGKSSTQQAFFRLLTKWQAPVEGMPEIIVDPFKELASMNCTLELAKAPCQDYLDSMLNANVQKWRLPEWNDIFDDEIITKLTPLVVSLLSQSIVDMDDDTQFEEKKGEDMATDVQEAIVPAV